MKIEDIDKKLEDLEKQQNELEKQRKEALIDIGKAFRCVKCNQIVKICSTDKSEISNKICYRCLRIEKEEKLRKEIIKKLKYGRVVDVEFGYSSTDIECIAIHKDGITYEVKSYGEQNDYMYIESETKEHIDFTEEDKIKPWMKPRKEKPIFK